MHKNCNLYLFSDNYPSDWINKNSSNQFNTFATITTANTYNELETYLNNFEDEAQIKLIQYKEMDLEITQKQYFQDLLLNIKENWSNDIGWINCYSYKIKSIDRIFESITQKLRFGFGDSAEGNIHEYLSFDGLHHTQPINKNKLNTLYLWLYMILDLYNFYKDKSVEYGHCNSLKTWVYSDLISGDSIHNRKSEIKMNSILNAFNKTGYLDNNDSIEFITIPKKDQNLSLIFVDNIAHLLNDILTKQFLLEKQDDITIVSTKFGWNILNENAEIREVSKEFPNLFNN